MLSLEEARRRIVEQVTPLRDRGGSETVPLPAAQGRILAVGLSALRAQPGFDNSAMDGYAVRAADTAAASADAPVELPVAATLPAGSAAEPTLAAGTAMRIFTGAPVPPGADAVIMQEDTDGGARRVAIHRAARPGQHVRRAGEDVAVGDPLLEPGQVVRAGDIGMLAADGRSWVQVVRRPRVAIVATGDELSEIDEPLSRGRVPNSNSVLLAAQVTEAGGIPIRGPILKDNRDSLAAGLRAAASSADLIVSSGGVSVGDFDHVREVLGDLGNVDFWRVAIKPGKPLAFGHIDGVPLVGLPGNPVSTFVTFELFARPALRKLGGYPDLTRPRARARLASAWRPGERRELLRGRLERRAGETWLVLPARQGSAHLTSIVRVDALADIPPGGETIPEGTEVDVIVLDGAALATSV